MDTDLTRAGRQHFPDLNDRVLRRTPAGRWGVIDDFAGVAVFLASGASDFITGAVITVDGGYSVQGRFRVLDTSGPPTSASSAPGSASTASSA